MIEIPIKYTDYRGNELTENFTFNMTKLELIEADLDIGGFEETATRLTKTSDGREAYYLFKSLLMKSYGRVSEDGRRFLKSDEIRSEFEQSPACAELIISFLKDPQNAIEFFNGVFPADMRDEVSKARAQQVVSDMKNPEEGTVQNLGATGPADEQDTEIKHFEDFEDSELLAMNDEAFQALLPKKGQMTRRQLNISQRRKQS